MNQFLQLIGLLITVALLVVVFVLEMAGHLDVIQQKFPELWVVMHSRPIMFFLLVAILAFLQRDFRDALPQYPAPVVKIAAPFPPVIQTTTIQPQPIVNVLPSVSKSRAYMSFLEPEVKYELGSPVSVNIRCATKSETPARNVSCEGQFFVVPIVNGTVDAKIEGDSYKAFEGNTKPLPENQRPSVEQGESAFGTSFGPVLTKELQTTLDGGGYTFLVAGALFFKDDAGQHRSDFCVWLQPPLSDKPRIWHVCHSHTGIVY